MPNYDYLCTNCSHTWEERRALGDHAATCPQCGGPGRHVFAPVWFRFALGKRGQLLQPQAENEGEVHSRVYEPGETVGDPMLDDGFERVG